YFLFISPHLPRPALFPYTTLFRSILAMYHDQGLIPFKTIAFSTGVNFTAGLPIVRTSPDHGTAYGIAGKNQADEGSMRSAIFQADRKSTRLNSSHVKISYAVFCLK